MPELPEVESVRRGLANARIRTPITEVWRSSQALRIGEHWQRKHENLQCLVGATPGKVGRRGKYLLWQMRAADEQPLILLIHLGMSGRCGIARPDQPKLAHTHLIVDFAEGRQLRFVDPRRFGGLRAGPRELIETSEPIVGLGPEPLDRRFDGRVLAESLGRSRRALRDALLDQSAVAGIGNIYAIEALFEAGLHPLLEADRLGPSAWQRLAECVQLVLRRGIDKGGTTLKDFRNVVGEPGRNQDDLRVYGRAGEPCRSCGAILKPFVNQGRSGVFCPVDQAKPRKRRVD
ncbi:bifunctional DNA-formamidopyrimidine glycosylase/DNA-(apurinic or apyrimidinic site) lyase [Nannocystaceae bacterium ST9]